MGGWLKSDCQPHASDDGFDNNHIWSNHNLCSRYVVYCRSLPNEL